jgi:hypothetical protein
MEKINSEQKPLAFMTNLIVIIVQNNSQMVIKLTFDGLEENIPEVKIIFHRSLKSIRSTLSSVKLFFEYPLLFQQQAITENGFISTKEKVIRMVIFISMYYSLFFIKIGSNFYSKG